LIVYIKVDYFFFYLVLPDLKILHHTIWCSSLIRYSHGYGLCSESFPSWSSPCFLQASFMTSNLDFISSSIVKLSWKCQVVNERTIFFHKSRITYYFGRPRRPGGGTPKCRWHVKTLNSALYRKSLRSSKSEFRKTNSPHD